jgi:hypothetical protein
MDTVTEPGFHRTQISSRMERKGKKKEAPTTGQENDCKEKKKTISHTTRTYLCLFV